MSVKRCSRCQQDKSLDEFHWDEHMPDAHRGICADCLIPSRTPGPVRRRKNPSEMADELASGMRICRDCGQMKALEGEFYKSRRKDGRIYYSPDCKRCRCEHARYHAPMKRVYNLEYHRTNREALLLQQRIRSRARAWDLKMTVLTHYGLQCACCGEKNPYFLQIDHVNGKGRQHRASLEKHAGHHFYAWLIKQGFPQGYRTLCANCNSALGYYGFCPHQGRGKQLHLL